MEWCFSFFLEDLLETKLNLQHKEYEQCNQKKFHNNKNVKTDNFHITKQAKKSQYNVACSYLLYLYMCTGVHITNVMRMEMCVVQTYLCVRVFVTKTKRVKKMWTSPTYVCVWG